MILPHFSIDVQRRLTFASDSGYLAGRWLLTIDSLQLAFACSFKRFQKATESSHEGMFHLGFRDSIA